MIVGSHFNRNCPLESESKPSTDTRMLNVSPCAGEALLMESVTCADRELTAHRSATKVDKKYFKLKSVWLRVRKKA